MNQAGATCHLWHNWERWEQYEIHDGHWMKRRQRRRCFKCGKEEDELIRMTDPPATTQPEAR